MTPSFARSKRMRKTSKSGFFVEGDLPGFATVWHVMVPSDRLTSSEKWKCSRMGRPVTHAS